MAERMAGDGESARVWAQRRGVWQVLRRRSRESGGLDERASRAQTMGLSILGTAKE